MIAWKQRLSSTSEEVGGFKSCIWCFLLLKKKIETQEISMGTVRVITISDTLDDDLKILHLRVDRWFWCNKPSSLTELLKS